MLLVLLMGVPWLVSYASGAAMLGLALLADRIWPGATLGNCWSHALVRAWRGGGYVGARPSRLWFGPLPIPHAIWIPPAGISDAEQTEPVERCHALRDALWGAKILYFRHRITRGADLHGDWRRPPP